MQSRARASRSSRAPATHHSSRRPAGGSTCSSTSSPASPPPSPEAARTRVVSLDGHGGRLAAAVLQAHGVEVVFTLSGGHLFVLYDGCVTAGVVPLAHPPPQTGPLAAGRFVHGNRRPGGR